MAAAPGRPMSSGGEQMSPSRPASSARGRRAPVDSPFSIASVIFEAFPELVPPPPEEPPPPPPPVIVEPEPVEEPAVVEKADAKKKGRGTSATKKGAKGADADKSKGKPAKDKEADKAKAAQVKGKEKGQSKEEAIPEASVPENPPAADAPVEVVEVVPRELTPLEQSLRAIDEECDAMVDNYAAMEEYLAGAAVRAKEAEAAALAAMDAEFTRMHRRTGLPIMPSPLELDTGAIQQHGLINPKRLMSANAAMLEQKQAPPRMLEFMDTEHKGYLKATKNTLMRGEMSEARRATLAASRHMGQNTGQTMGPSDRWDETGAQTMPQGATLGRTMNGDARLGGGEDGHNGWGGALSPTSTYPASGRALAFAADGTGAGSPGRGRGVSLKTMSPRTKKMSAEQWETEQKLAKRMHDRLNFLRNPRFATTQALDVMGAGTKGGAHGSTMSPHGGPRGGTVRGQGQVSVRNHADFGVEPPVVEFSEFAPGNVYQQTIHVRNKSGIARRVRFHPPATPAFAISATSFPQETGGLLAPGMSCSLTLLFKPASLADHMDMLPVKTEVDEFDIPLVARRLPPKLILPPAWECGPCLEGLSNTLVLPCKNAGGTGRFRVFPLGCRWTSVPDKRADLDELAMMADACQGALLAEVGGELQPLDEDYLFPEGQPLDSGAVVFGPFSVAPCEFDLSMGLDSGVDLVLRFAPVPGEGEDAVDDIIIDGGGSAHGEGGAGDGEGSGRAGGEQGNSGDGAGNLSGGAEDALVVGVGGSSSSVFAADGVGASFTREMVSARPARCQAKLVEARFLILCDNWTSEEYVIRGVSAALSGQVRAISLDGRALVPGEVTSCDLMPLLPSLPPSALRSLSMETTVPGGTNERTLVVRSTAPLPLPFQWRMLALAHDDLGTGSYLGGSGAAADVSDEGASVPDTSAARHVFVVEPAQGELPERGEMTFKLAFTPFAPGRFEQTMELLVPLEHMGDGGKGGLARVLQTKLDGAGEAVTVTLSPTMVHLTGGVLADKEYTREVALQNHGVAEIQFEWSPGRWASDTDDTIIAVNPDKGSVGAHSTRPILLWVKSGSRPGPFGATLTCRIKYGPTLDMHVAGEIKGPSVRLEPAVLDFGYVQVGTTKGRELTIVNTCSARADWQLSEHIPSSPPRSRASSARGRERGDNSNGSGTSTPTGASGSLAYRHLEEGAIGFTQAHGSVPPLGERSVTVEFSPESAGTLRGAVALHVEGGGATQYTELRGCAVIPRAVLSERVLADVRMYAGIRMTRTLKLRNVTPLPAVFQWDALPCWVPTQGDDGDMELPPGANIDALDPPTLPCLIGVHPAQGTLAPHEEMLLTATFDPKRVTKSLQMVMGCDVVGGDRPLGFSVSGVIAGISVMFFVSPPVGGTSSDTGVRDMLDQAAAAAVKGQPLAQGAVDRDTSGSRPGTAVSASDLAARPGTSDGGAIPGGDVDGGNRAEADRDMGGDGSATARDGAGGAEGTLPGGKAEGDEGAASPKSGMASPRSGAASPREGGDAASPRGAADGSALPGDAESGQGGGGEPGTEGGAGGAEPHLTVRVAAKEGETRKVDPKEGPPGWRSFLDGSDAFLDFGMDCEIGVPRSIVVRLRNVTPIPARVEVEWDTFGEEDAKGSPDEEEKEEEVPDYGPIMPTSPLAAAALGLTLPTGRRGDATSRSNTSDKDAVTALISRPRLREREKDVSENFRSLMGKTLMTTRGAAATMRGGTLGASGAKTGLLGATTPAPVLDEKGIRFTCVSFGMLEPHGECTFIVTALSSMCGEYWDQCHFYIPGLPRITLPVRAGVRGSPLVIQRDQTRTAGLVAPKLGSPTLIKWPASYAGALPATKSFGLRNPSAHDIRVTWQMFLCTEAEDGRLVDVGVSLDKDGHVCVSADAHGEPVGETDEAPFVLEPMSAVIPRGGTTTFQITFHSEVAGNKRAFLRGKQYVSPPPSTEPPPIKIILFGHDLRTKRAGALADIPALDLHAHAGGAGVLSLRPSSLSAAVAGGGGAGVASSGVDTAAAGDVHVITLGSFHEFAAHPPRPMPDIVMHLDARTLDPRLETDNRDSLEFVAFAHLPVTDTSYTQELTLSNTSPVTLTFKLDTRPPFSLPSAVPSLAQPTQAEPLHFTLPPRESVDLAVRFAPPRADMGEEIEDRRYHGPLAILFSNSVRQDFPLLAHYIHPEVHAAPTTLTFKPTHVNAPRSMTLVLTNVTKADAHWSILEGVDYATEEEMAEVVAAEQAALEAGLAEGVPMAATTVKPGTVGPTKTTTVPHGAKGDLQKTGAMAAADAEAAAPVSVFRVSPSSGCIAGHHTSQPYTVKVTITFAPTERRWYHRSLRIKVREGRGCRVALAGPGTFDEACE
eukprot:jgi/Mesvir1/28289/Mv04813-RA.1